MSKKLCCLFERLESKVSSICHPLFSYTPLNYFSYSRVYADSVFVLSSNVAWEKHAQFSGYHLHELQQGSRPGHHFWGADESMLMVQQQAKYFYNLDNSLNIVMPKQVGEDYYEIFGFGSSANCERVLPFYQSFQDELAQFNAYFLRKAGSLVDHSHDLEKRTSLPVNFDQSLIQAKHSKPLSISKQCVENIDKKSRYYYQHDVYLTRRETQIFYYTAVGKTAREVAIRLKISPKSVESYLAMVKMKLNIKKRSDIFSRAKELDIVDIFRNDCV